MSNRDKLCIVYNDFTAETALKATHFRNNNHRHWYNNYDTDTEQFHKELFAAS